MIQGIRQLGQSTAERLLQSHVLSKRKAWSVLKASGKKIRDYLQGQITQDMQKLTSTQGIHACVLSPQGKAVGELYIIESGHHELIILTPATDAAAVVERLRRFAVGFDVRIGMVSSMGICSIQGANANDALALFELDVPEQRWLACSHADNIDTMVMPVGPVGFWVIAANEVIDTVLAANSSAVVDEEEIEAMCIIRGLPRFGVDWTSETHPLNANLIEFEGVCFEKGCYVGQEVTSRMHWRGGIRKKLYRVMIQGDADTIKALPCPIYLDGITKIGELTSVAVDHEESVYGIALLSIDTVDGSKPLFLAEQQPVTVLGICHA